MKYNYEVQMKLCNFLVCESCDCAEVKEKWREINNVARAKYWWFR